MAMHCKFIPQAMQPQLQADYEEGVLTVETLAARAGLSCGTFRKRVRELGWVRRRRPVRRDKKAAMRARKSCKTSYKSSRKPSGKPRRRATASPHALDAEVSAALAAAPQRDPPADSHALALRIRRNLERELSALERLREGGDASDLARLDLAARMLTGLVRSLQEAIRIERTPPQEENDTDELPRNIDELRRSLLERMDRIVAARADGAAGGDGQA